MTNSRIMSTLGQYLYYYFKLYPLYLAIFYCIEIPELQCNDYGLFPVLCKSLLLFEILSYYRNVL